MLIRSDKTRKHIELMFFEPSLCFLTTGDLHQNEAISGDAPAAIAMGNQ